MLNEKMIAVISAVNDEVAERRELINMIAICLLTRKNLFILRDTGAAKSYAINRFRRRNRPDRSEKLPLDNPGGASED